MVKFYVGTIVPHSNWHKAYDVGLFGGVGQYGLLIIIVKCNDGAVVPQPNWYQETLIFFRLLPSNCLNWKIYCNSHSPLSSTTAVQYEFHIYFPDGLLGK